jgi:hypothetical protein
MAFLVYERSKEDGKEVLIATRANFKLAGYNLLFKAWERCGKPLNQGWKVTIHELVEIHSSGKDTADTLRFIIDFDPNSRRRVGLIEILDIYAYTYASATPGEPAWTPLMLRGRDIYYKEFDRDITSEDKERIVGKLPFPENTAEFIEFLYLNGPDKGWNWGKNGMTNAAFIQGEAREFFRQYF